MFYSLSWYLYILRWSAIATHLPKRTDNEIKNYWNTHLKKRLAKMGIDPVTHKPKSATLGSPYGDPKSAANLIHMAQWESTRLEAEARLVKDLRSRQHQPPSSSGPPPPSPSSKLLDKLATTIAPPRCLDVLKVWQGFWSESSQGGGGSSGGDGGGFSENALAMLDTGILSEFTGILGSIGSEIVEACGMDHQEMVFDAGGGGGGGGGFSENALAMSDTGILSEFTGILGSIGGEIVEACDMDHQEMVFDAGDAWIMKPWGTNEANFDDGFANTVESPTFMSSLDNAFAMPIVGLSDFAGFLGSFGGEIVEACGLHHQDIDMVFDAGEANFYDGFTNFLYNNNPDIHEERNASIGLWHGL